MCCSCDGREGAPRPWPVLTLAHIHGSLRDNNIGDDGARDLGAALQVNTTLMTLMCGLYVHVDVRRRSGCDGSPATLASAHTCKWAAFISTTLVLEARGLWAQRCRSTQR
jgi:hypothetical protein